MRLYGIRGAVCCENTVEDIKINVGEMCGKIFSDGSSQLEIDSFADEHFAADIYAKIGSGMNLADFKNGRVPEQAKHLLDDFKIVSGENPFDFHFKSANQRTGSV